MSVKNVEHGGRNIMAEDQLAEKTRPKTGDTFRRGIFGVSRWKITIAFLLDCIELL